MKTLIVYELVPEETKFFIVEGDRSDLNGCFVNTVGCEKKFSKEVFDEVAGANEKGEWGEEVQTPITTAGEIQRVVHCGFIL